MLMTLISCREIPEQIIDCMQCDKRYSLGFLTKLLSISCKFVFGRKEQKKSELTWVAAGLWS